MKKIILLTMLAALCSTALLAGCGDSPASQPTPANSVPEMPQSSAINSTSSNTPQSSTPDSKGNLGDYNVEILGVKVVKNSDNEDVAIVQFNFTNVSNDKAANFGTSVATQIYQNGVQLSNTTADRNDYDFESYYTNVKQGASVAVDYCVKLSDTTSPIEVDVSQAFTVNGAKVSKTLDLPQA